MFCTKCGSKLPDGTLFCSNCGASLGGGIPTAGAPLRPADEIDYKLYGDDMQLVEIELDPGESVLAEAGAMTYLEKDIKMETIFGDGSGQDQSKGLWGTLANAGKRALSGESLFMTVLYKRRRRKVPRSICGPIPRQNHSGGIKRVRRNLNLPEKRLFVRREGCCHLHLV